MAKALNMLYTIYKETKRDAKMKDYNLFIDRLAKLISARSVKSKAKDGMPFGEGVNDAFNCFTSICHEMGFQTINYDNYMGEVCVGDGEEIGIIGHLDVVPEGSGWSTDPYTLTYKDGAYYGRGVMDDKAPLLMCLTAIKELLDEGEKFNKKIRLFYGLDEESDWQDIAYFKKNHTFPKYGFSPDGNFPVVYAEKGLNKVTFKLKKFKNFKDVTGGTVFNAVCGRCSVTANFLPDEDELKKFNLSFDGGKIVSVGKSCHGSRPQLGINAIKGLFEYLLYKGEDVKNALDYLFYDKAGLFAIENEQGGVTLSPNIIYEKDDGVYILCDVRVPAPITLKDLMPIFDGFGIEYVAEVHRDPLLVPKDSDFVQTLLKAYNDVLGCESKPASMSGGTFAYVFDQGCAFGPELPGMDSGIHEPDEHVSEKDLKNIYKIYKTTIKNLVQ